MCRGEVAHLLHNWHHEAFYHFSHHGIERTFRTTRGVRQGCVCAPFLWLLFSLKWMTQLACQLSWQWIREHLTVFADDVHGSWNLHEEKQLYRALEEVRHLLLALAASGLDINKIKTVLLVRLVGKRAKAAMKKLVYTEGGQKYMRLPVLQNDSCPASLRLVHEHEYLGSKISYHNARDKNVRHRIRAGQRAFHQLRRWGKGAQVSECTS